MHRLIPMYEVFVRQSRESGENRCILAERDCSRVENTRESLRYEFKPPKSVQRTVERSVVRGLEVDPF